MRGKLTFIGHSFLVLPLCFINALPNGVLTEVQVEGLPETDTSTLLNCVLDTTLFRVFPHLKRQMFVLSLGFGSEEVSVSFDAPAFVK